MGLHVSPRRYIGADSIGARIEWVRLKLHVDQRPFHLNMSYFFYFIVGIHVNCGATWVFGILVMVKERGGWSKGCSHAMYIYNLCPVYFFIHVT